MSAHTFKITLDDTTHEVVDTAVCNQKGAAHGRWTSENEGDKTVWRFISEQGIVGTSGALLIKPRNNSNDVCHMVAFGYWYVNSKPWFGAVADLDSWGGGDALSEFYGNEKYSKEGVYWTKDTQGFKVTGRMSHEEISFVSGEDFGTGELDVSILILRTWR